MTQRPLKFQPVKEANIDIDTPLKEAFLTGSRVYGTPKRGSDIDLVVTLAYGSTKLLEPLADEIIGSYDDGDLSLRFGKLNLLVLPEKKALAWRVGTEKLMEQGPVTREFAKQELDKWEAVYNV